MMASWVETYVARVQAAKRFLAVIGVHAKRTSDLDPIAEWLVPGFVGYFSNEDLVLLAERYGFDRNSVDTVQVSGVAA